MDMLEKYNQQSLDAARSELREAEQEIERLKELLEQGKTDKLTQQRDDAQRELKAAREENEILRGYKQSAEQLLELLKIQEQSDARRKKEIDRLRKILRENDTEYPELFDFAWQDIKRLEQFARELSGNLSRMRIEWMWRGKKSIGYDR